MRLVGDVHAVDQDGRVVERIEGQALDAEAVLMAYLNREQVRSPIEYVCVSAKVQRQWLPLFYFVRLAGGDRNAAIAALEETNAVYRVSKDNALQRLRGQRLAFEQPGGAILDALALLEQGDVANLRGDFTDFQIVRAIRGLPDGFEPYPQLFDLLREIYLEAEGDANVRSGSFRASARLDELEDQASVNVGE